MNDADLLNMDKATVSSEEQENRLALALFSDGATTTPKWEPFGSAEQSTSAPAGNWQDSMDGKAGWELALVESTSHISKPQTGTLAGGLDSLLLTSMYDQGLVNQQQAISQAAAAQGSASSVAILPRPASTFLALPAPPGETAAPVGGHDPFAASAVVPPPAYVQMADLTKKQQHLTQEQAVWQQYQMDGMRGEHSFMKNPYGAPVMPQQNMAGPYYNVGMPMHNPYVTY